MAKRKINAGTAALTTPEPTTSQGRRGGARTNKPRRAIDPYVAVKRGRLAELEADAARLDALEREVRDEPLTLHNVAVGEAIRYGRGLGLASTRRTLRQAIDDLVGRPRR